LSRPRNLPSPGPVRAAGFDAVGFRKGADGGISATMESRSRGAVAWSAADIGKTLRPR
jgi:hypothetical protein